MTIGTTDDEEVKKPEKLSPFDFIKSVTQTKKDLLAEDPTREPQYAPYVVNKGLSHYADTIFHANIMNGLYDLPKRAQYQYYLGALRQGKRFAKWPKAEPSETLDHIQERYGVRREVAKHYLSVMTPDQIETLNRSMSKGGA